MSLKTLRITYYKMINLLNIPRIIENIWVIIIAAIILSITFTTFFMTTTNPNTIGYTPDGPTYTTPGYHLKNPFTPITYLKNTYHSIYFEIPTQTSDGHQLTYNLELI